MVYMLLGTGFEETEAVAPLDLLRRAGVEVKTVGLNGKVVYGSHNIGIEADIEIAQMDLTDPQAEQGNAFCRTRRVRTQVRQPHPQAQESDP